MNRILFFLISFFYISAAHALPECRGDITKRWQNCVGTYTYTNGDKYVGEFKDGKKHGQGTYYYLADNQWKGDKYVGEFKDDKIHGQGTYYYLADNQWKGDKYVGEYKDDKKHGQGTYTFGPNSEFDFHTVTGEFKDNEPVWPLTFIYPDGHQEIGRVENGVIVRDFAAEEKQRRAEEQRRAENEDELLQSSSGSAFVVSRDGYLVTNNHVINGCEQVAIHSDGVTIPVSIVTYDSQNDLALLKGQFSPTHVFPIRRSNPALLEDVYVAGFPFGEKYSSSIKVTKGIISALTGIGNNFSNFQIDAALQPGNSGGPILDENGNVIGVAVAKLDMKYALENWGALPENINFGIKSNVVMSVLESQRVNVFGENSAAIDKRKLGEQISLGTYYVSCWMTSAQIEQMREKKVMFENLK